MDPTTLPDWALSLHAEWAGLANTGPSRSLLLKPSASVSVGGCTRNSCETSGLRALEKDIIWRVGDGTQIRIWDDPWIPAGTTRRPRTPRGAALVTRVAELIDPITGTWDHQLVKDLFWEEDAINILAIPVRQNSDDIIAWHYDPKGIFSVKSAYHVLEGVEEQKRQVQKGETSRQGACTSEDRLWKDIWHLQCPPKIKQFIWRVAHNSLAMKMNIKRRHVDLDTRCPVCLRLDEDGGHCFLKCKQMRRCWRELQLDSVRCLLLNAQTSKEFIRCILGLKTDQCLRTCLLLWKWWDARNKANASEPMPSCLDVVCAVNSIFRELSIEESKTTQIQVPRKRWKPPDQQFLKINVDGSFIKEDNVGACGFIVRNYLGEPVLAGASNISPALDALSAETLACLFALESAQQVGISWIELEMDCSQLRDAITSQARDMAPNGVLFRSIRELLFDHFNCNKILLSPRSCNSSAHEIAKIALSWDPDQFLVWDDPLPEFVNNLAARDFVESTFVNDRP